MFGATNLSLVTQTDDAVAPSASALLALARSRDPHDRERLLLGIAALCQANAESLTASPSVAEVFQILAGQAEREIRKALAETLAREDWPPQALVNMLALDEIEIARPIIAHSPVMRDSDLMKVLVEATLEHQIEVARRDRLSARVADAIIDQAEPVVLTALAGNRTAEIGEGGVRRLVEHARRVAALRAPLIRHPSLNQVLAQQLYGFVGQALRQAISERFAVDSGALEDAVADAVDAANTGRRRLQTPELDNDEMEYRLIGKLDQSGQLRPGYLIRALREGRLGLFEKALAALGGFSVSQIRAALLSPTPQPLCLACQAVGIDRAVLPAMVEEVRKLNGGSPGGGDVDLSRRIPSPELAAREFRSVLNVS